MNEVRNSVMKEDLEEIEIKMKKECIERTKKVKNTLK